MTDTVKGAQSSLRETITSSPAVGRLKEEASAYAAAQAQRLMVSAGRRLGSATAKLEGLAQGQGSGAKTLALESGKQMAKGSGPVGSVVKAGAVTLKDRVKEALGKGGGRAKGGGGSGKFLTISEDIDVGVPVREAYDQYTQFQEFGTFAKGVRGVDQADDTTTNWRAKIFWSSRSWRAQVTEQVPDQRIVWTSDGAKGTTKGVVTFHELAENLTRVLVVIEYHPQGLMEKTGAIWRAQGRRVRLDLKQFRRFVMLRGEASGEWRGEVRDGEVVVSHEDAVAEEEERAREGDERDERQDEPRSADERYEDDEAPEDEFADDEEYVEVDERDDDRDDEPRAEEAYDEDEEELEEEPERERASSTR